MSLLPPEELADLKLVGNNSLFPWQPEDKGICEVWPRELYLFSKEETGDLAHLDQCK